MTTTPSTDIAAILGAKKAELKVVPEPETQTAAGGADYIPPPPADPTTGEIVPVPEGHAPSAPAPIEPRYPEIPPKVVGGLPYIRDYVKLARTIDRTEMVPVAFRGRFDAITAAFMRGYEMGLGPMQALDSFNVIQGKVGLTAEAMRALILNAGHDIILTDGDGFATAECHRKQWPADKWATYVYSMEDARVAGLTGKDSWKKNPRAMLDARATSGAGRRYFADVLAGMSYTPEEIRDFSGPDQEVQPSSPASTPPSTAPAPEADSATETPPTPPVDDTDGASATSSPTTPDTAPPTAPRRPRGRPRKQPPAAPIAAPPEETTLPIAVEESPSSAAEPELTSLNAPEPGQGAVVGSMRQAYSEVIKSLPQTQQPLCRAFIARQFPGKMLSDLDDAEIQKAINIAAGWPDSIEQYALPDDEEAL